MSDICRKKNYDSFYVQWRTLDEAGPVLVESDRAFSSNDMDCKKPLIFQKEEAYVKFNTDSKHSISVESNVGSSDSIPSSGTTVVSKDDKGIYNVVSVNARQAAVLNKLMEIKKFPESAKEQVRNMLTKLEQVIEVRSPLLDSKSIPNIKGSAAICARIRPSESMT